MYQLQLYADRKQIQLGFRNSEHFRVHIYFNIHFRSKTQTDTGKGGVGQTIGRRRS